MAPSQVDALELLRPLMESHSPPLHALVVPSEDYHQSEYVADADKRREFVSGFNGSAGVALITANEALLWTDGRYFLQATQQLGHQWKLMRIGEDPLLENWITDNLHKDANVGVDPSCISVDAAHRWQQAFSKHGQKLVSLKENMVDRVWDNRPAHAVAPVCIQPLEFTGKTAKDKISDLRGKLKQEKAHAIVVTTLDEVAWLYNLRGGDVLYNPVVHAYAIVTRDSAYYYVNKAKVDLKVEQYLCENGVELRDYETVFEDVEALASEKLSAVKEASAESAEKNGLANGCGNDEKSESAECRPAERLEDLSNAIVEGSLDHAQIALIWLDPGTCSFAVYSRVAADRVVLQQSPLALAKALKHPVELDGMRNCHIRDAAAVISYTCWLDAQSWPSPDYLTQMQDLYGAAGFFSEVKGSLKRKRSEEEKLTEVTVADKLQTFRSKQEHFKGLSFDTISSVGGNAAIIHYSAKEETCAEMQPDSMYLCDSGGQPRAWYSRKALNKEECTDLFRGLLMTGPKDIEKFLLYLDGTTDVTRTMHFGKPTSHEKTCATQVLKGHIALDMAVFPAGTTGHALDILARVPLWKDGLDYRHGTGHGVGSYLNVHEGPHLISFRPHARNVALQANMTVTNEPGYYEDGNFGVRIENVMIVKEAQAKHNFGGGGYLSFEHITWVPYQTKLMDLSLMSEVEKDWVDEYHRVCREKVSSLLSGPELEWLHKATETLSR